MRKAKTEFESGNYAKALSLAVRARKSLSVAASSDTIPLRKAPEVAEELEDIAGSAEGAKVEMRCVSCNSMVLPDDMFCATCGAPSAGELTCPSCGQVAKSGDRFCRKCGGSLR